MSFFLKRGIFSKMGHMFKLLFFGKLVKKLIYHFFLVSLLKKNLVVLTPADLWYNAWFPRYCHVAVFWEGVVGAGTIYSTLTLQPGSCKPKGEQHTKEKPNKCKKTHSGEKSNELNPLNIDITSWYAERWRKYWRKAKQKPTIWRPNKYQYYVEEKILPPDKLRDEEPEGLSHRSPKVCQEPTKPFWSS